VNTKKIQGRKGVGNMPFVFFSNASLSLSDPDGTLRMGSIETLRWNRIGAFDRYLKAEEEKERAARGDDDDDDDEDGELDPDMVCPLSLHSRFMLISFIVLFNATTLRDVVLPIYHLFKSGHAVSCRTVNASTD